MESIHNLKAFSCTGIFCSNFNLILITSKSFHPNQFAIASTLEPGRRVFSFLRFEVQDGLGSSARSLRVHFVAEGDRFPLGCFVDFCGF